MPVEWIGYPCVWHGREASVLINAALRDEVPIAGKEWLLWVWLYPRDPGARGLQERLASDRLTGMEYRLSAELLNCGAVLADSVATEGRREIYFYGQNPQEVRAVVGLVMQEFEEYRYQCGMEFDPLWHQYYAALAASQAIRREQRYGT